MLRVYMKFWLAVWIAGFLSVSGVGAMTESHKIASPDGSIEISVEIKKRILYSVRCDEQEILASSPMALFAPVAGFFTGLMFAALSLYITSFVTTINHFNFYFTGLLTPMFFFSGIVFPLTDLPPYLQTIAEFFPLTHSVNIVRAFCFNTFHYSLIFDVIYMMVFFNRQE